MGKDFSNTDDMIDTRDICERIEELESICLPVHNTETGEDEFDSSVTKEKRGELQQELEALRALVEEIEDYSGDACEDGVTLIRDSHFKDYARELAEDIGAIDKAARWPNNCIDWDHAASELRMDYTSVEFNGVTYWFR